MLIEYCKAHFTPKDIDPVTPQPGFDAGTTLSVIIAIYGIEPQEDSATGTFFGVESTELTG